MRNRAEKYAVRCCHVTHQFINSGNGYVINDHLQAKNASAGRASRYVITTTRAEILILWLFDLSDLLLVLPAPVVVFTNLYQSIRVTKHSNLIIEACYELMC